MIFFRLMFISGALHTYIGWRLLPALENVPLAEAALLLAIVASAVCMPFGILANRIRSRRLSDALAWAGFLCMGLFSSLFVLTLGRDVLLPVSLIVGQFTPNALSYPQFRALTGQAVPVLALLITILGFLNARRTAAVVAVDVPIDRLPRALEGFTIAQISDIHVGPTIKHGYLTAIVQAVNRLDADIVAVTGDLVDGSVAALGEHVAPLQLLTSKHGTFFVTGNHEYYSGAHAWIAELRRLGIRVLMNEHVVIRHGDAKVVVAGVADFGAHNFDPAHRSDPLLAVAGAPPDAAVRVLLAHQPRSATAAAPAGFDLQVSGHTHGGQFFPWIFFVRLQQPFTAGLHRVNDLWVYVSRGTGYWGPPKRFGAPSEITRLRLVQGMPSFASGPSELAIGEPEAAALGRS
jgi:uncharacterized protein